MDLLKIHSIEPLIYVVLGIDENEHDQVVAVFKTYETAARYCTKFMVDTPFLDVWIEKHPLM